MLLCSNSDDDTTERVTYEMVVQSVNIDFNMYLINLYVLSSNVIWIMILSFMQCYLNQRNCKSNQRILALWSDKNNILNCTRFLLVIIFSNRKMNGRSYNSFLKISVLLKYLPTYMLQTSTCLDPPLVPAQHQRCHLAFLEAGVVSQLLHKQIFGYILICYTK